MSTLEIIITTTTTTTPTYLMMQTISWGDKIFRTHGFYFTMMKTMELYDYLQHKLIREQAFQLHLIR